MPEGDESAIDVMVQLSDVVNRIDEFHQLMTNWVGTYDRLTRDWEQSGTRPLDQAILQVDSQLTDLTETLRKLDEEFARIRASAQIAMEM